MATQTIEALIDGGKASAAPPLGPALGPLGVNIGQVISTINEKTASFKGMQVPIKVIVDKDTKEFTIEVGTPPASALIKKEAGIEKGSGNPLSEKIADIRIENIIKIAKMKEDNLLGKTVKDRVKEVIGTCNSMGVMVEGVAAKDAIKLVNEGKFDKEISAGKTELSAEELKEMEEERKKLKEEIERRRAEFESMAKKILNEFSGKEKNFLKAKMVQAGIPDEIIKEQLPTDAAAGAAAGGDKKEAKPAAPTKK